MYFRSSLRWLGLCLSLLLSLVTHAGTVPSDKPQAYPEWWYLRDVIKSTSGTTYASADDYGAANIGQLKNIAAKAAAELDDKTSGGAGEKIHALIESWSQTLPPPAQRDDYAILNLGQLKAVAKLFYNRLYEIGFRGPPLKNAAVYPWSDIPLDDDAYAVVNLGQLKRIFSFNLNTGLQSTNTDLDNDGLRDKDELIHWGNLSVSAAADTDNDGLTNLQELNLGLDPTVAETFAANSPYLPKLDPILNSGGNPIIDGRMKFEGAAAVRLTNLFPLGVLRYTLDGTEPSLASPICVSGNLVEIPPQGNVDLKVGLFLGTKSSPACVTTGLYTLKNPFGDTAGTGPGMNITGSARLPVARPLFLVSKPDVGLFLGESAIVIAKTNYAYLDLNTTHAQTGGQNVTWSIVNPTTPAVVQLTGANDHVKIRALNYGVATIKATVNGWQAECQITVPLHDTGNTSGNTLGTATGSEIPLPFSFGDAFSNTNQRMGWFDYGNYKFHIENAGWVTFTRQRLVYAPAPIYWYNQHVNYSYHIAGTRNPVMASNYSYNSTPAGYTQTHPQGTGWFFSTNDDLQEYGVTPELHSTGARIVLEGVDSDGDGMWDAFEREYFTTRWVNSFDTSVPRGNDSDADTLPDVYEIYRSFLNPTVTVSSNLDLDNDGVNHRMEYSAGTNPLVNNRDSDADGITDADEINIYNTNPLLADTDSDGLPDAFEISVQTSPTTPRQEKISGDFQTAIFAGWQDTDGDWLPNSYEAVSGRNSTGDSSVADSDGDGLSNRKEWSLGTRPDLADTDGDGMPDKWEVDHQLDPKIANGDEDADRDDLSNLLEYEFASNPRSLDSETSTPDPRLVNPYTGSASYGDGIFDLEEILLGLDPALFDAYLPSLANSGLNSWAQLKDTSGDSDGDGLSDYAESVIGSNPLTTNSDADPMTDEWEHYYKLKPAVAGDAVSTKDSDGDKVSDLEEYQRGILPNDYDSDNDGLNDAWEIAQGLNPATLREGLLAWWRFDQKINTAVVGTTPVDTIVDSAQARHPGRLRAEATLTPGAGTQYNATTHPLDGALSLDGNDAYVVVPDFNLPKLDGDFTISLWFWPQPSSLGQTRQLLERRGAYQLETRFSGGVKRIVFTAFVGETALSFASNQSLTEGSWNHIAVSLDKLNRQLHLYINGVATITPSTTALANPFDPTPWPLIIGSQRTPPPSRTPYGKLDDLRIYGRRLSAGDIALLANPASTDWDRNRNRDPDTLTDVEEYRNGTDPLNSDTDGDGLSDSDELYHSDPAKRSSPLRIDTDGDGLTDPQEINVHGTSPSKADTDGDGLNDKDEIFLPNGSARTPALSSALTYIKNNKDYKVISPNLPFLRYDGWDTDSDRMPDAWEVFYNFDPAAPTDAFSIPLNAITDPDNDGISNRDEYAKGKQPRYPDPNDIGIVDDDDDDDDGLSDWLELYVYGSNPNDPETIDGTNDLRAALYGLLPLGGQGGPYYHPPGGGGSGGDGSSGGGSSGGDGSGGGSSGGSSSGGGSSGGGSSGGGSSGGGSSGGGSGGSGGNGSLTDPTERSAVATLAIPITLVPNKGKIPYNAPPPPPVVIPGQPVALRYVPGDQVFLAQDAFGTIDQLITAVHKVYLRDPSGAVPDHLLSPQAGALEDVDPFDHLGERAQAGYAYGQGHDITEFAARLPLLSGDYIRFQLILEVNPLFERESPPVPEPNPDDYHYDDHQDPVDDIIDRNGNNGNGGNNGGGWGGWGWGLGWGWLGGRYDGGEGHTPPSSSYQPPPPKPWEPESKPVYATTRVMAFVINRLDLAITHASTPDRYLTPAEEDQPGAVISQASSGPGNTLQFPVQRAKLRVGKGPANTASRTITWNDTSIAVLDEAGSTQTAPLTYTHNDVVELRVVAKPNMTSAATLHIAGTALDNSPLVGDSVRVALVTADLDADSDNTNGTNSPDRSQAEEDLESAASANTPGKILRPATNDEDGDLVPDYADGLDRSTNDGARIAGQPQSAPLVPIILQINPGSVNWSNIKLRFDYSGSDPARVNRYGTKDTYVYSPAHGDLRIWSKSAQVIRKTASIQAGGDYIPPGTDISASTLGLNSSTATVTLYVEAITPSQSLRDRFIKLQLAIIGDDGTTGGHNDIAKIEFTAVSQNLLVDSDRDGNIESPTPSPRSFDDRTNNSSPYRYWSNDDDDNPGSTTEADYINTVVDGPDDLADFFPVFLDIKQLLGVLPPSATIRYKLKHAESALNFAYTSLTRANAFAYLTDTAATYGPSANRLASANVTERITAAGVYLDAYGYDFLNGIKDQGRGVILVEMREMTAAPLRLVVEKDGVEIAEIALHLVPVQKAPDYLEANTDYDERKLVDGYVASDAADPALAAISGPNAGTNRINDLHEGFFGLPPGVLPYSRTSGATVKIRKLAKTDLVLDAPQSGEVRLHRIWGEAPSQAEHIELYNPVTLAGHNIGHLYNAAPAEANSRYYLEGVKPGRITLEFSFQRSDLSFKFEQEFIITTRKSRAAWLAEITDQINVETGVNMLDYAVDKKFMEQKAQIQQIYRFYTGLHHRNPEVQRWGGLAKRAGCAVYAGFSDMQRYYDQPISIGDGADKAVILFLQDVLVHGGHSIYHDLVWQSRAYERGGYYALEFARLSNLDTGVGVIKIIELEPWLKIAQGDLGHDTSRILTGVFELTNREQEFIVQPAWDRINTAPTLFVLEHLLSYLAKNPLPTAADFFTVYPLKNVAIFDDRWPWVTNHMLPQWGAMAEPARNTLVDDPLVNAAAHYAILPVIP